MFSLLRAGYLVLEEAHDIWSLLTQTVYESWGQGRMIERTCPTSSMPDPHVGVWR